jgi:hypothetical protein
MVNLKKLYYLVRKYDGLWSVPLSFLMFYAIGKFFYNYIGHDVSVYDVGFIQPLMLSICVVIGSVNAGIIGLIFTIKGFHDWLYNNENDSAKENWKLLLPMERFKLVLFSLAFLIILIIVVYCHLT